MVLARFLKTTRESMMKTKGQEENEYTSVNDWYQDIKHLAWPLIIVLIIFMGALIFVTVTS